MKVTILYETSEGNMTQWHGKVITIKPTSVTIMRHKAELHVDFLKSNFVIVTKEFVKDFELSKNERYSQTLRDNLVELCKDNIQLLWINQKLVINSGKASPN